MILLATSIVLLWKSSIGANDMMKNKTTGVGDTITKDQNIYSLKGISAGIVWMWVSFYYMPLEIALPSDINISDNLKLLSQSSSYAKVTASMDKYT